MRFDRVFQSALAGAIAILAFAQGAFADFMLRIESVTAGTGVVITDNGSGDLNPATGVIIFNGSINGFLVNVTTGLSKPVIGGVNNYSELDLNSVNVLSVGAGTLLITLADTGFTNGPDGPASVIGNVGGTLTAPAGSFVFFNTWANPANLVPALGANTLPVGALGAIGATPSGSIAAFGAGVVFGPGAYSASGTEGFVKLGPYSLFSQARLTFTNPGSASFDLNTQAVPEPGTLLLLGTGLVGVAAWVRRRNNRG